MTITSAEYLAIAANTIVKQEHRIEKLEQQLEIALDKSIHRPCIVCAQNMKCISELAADVRFLLNFAPMDCPKSLDPTCYHTLSYDGDKKLQDRIDKIRTSIPPKG